jgi:hypothetical protein
MVEGAGCDEFGIDIGVPVEIELLGVIVTGGCFVVS